MYSNITQIDSGRFFKKKIILAQACTLYLGCVRDRDRYGKVWKVHVIFMSYSCVLHTVCGKI